MRGGVGLARDAIDRYEQVLSMTRDIEDRRGEGVALANLGLAYAELGETRDAIENYEHALAIFEAIENPNAVLVRQSLERLRGGSGAPTG